MRLDLDLIRKYAVAGPRYTSYPPATQFTGDFDDRATENAVRRDNEENISSAFSLYIHLPFCRQLCWYCGCNTIITRNPEEIDAYLDDIGREIRLLSRHMNPRRKVEQLHLGGGTPTSLDASQLRRLGKLLREHYVFESDAEISVEIDPRNCAPEQVEALREMGMNRASLGVQDLTGEVQEAVHRVQPEEIVCAAAELLRKAGIQSLNVDLIYGLPRQTPESFSASLEKVLGQLSPERLSVFSYAHVPWMKPAQKLLERAGAIPGPEEKLALFALAQERLTEAGYVDIGLDHFSLPNDEMVLAQKEGRLHRNFQGYSTRAGASLYGLGLSSISSTRDSYRQNFKDTKAYREALDSERLPVERGYRLNEEDLRRRELVMAIMCRRGFSFDEMSRKLGVDVRRRYTKELSSLKDLQDDGIVEMDGEKLVVTENGIPLLRVVAMRFDEYFKPATGRHALSV